MQENSLTEISRTIGNYEIKAKIHEESNLHVCLTYFCTGKKAERYSTKLSIDTMDPAMASFFVDLQSILTYLNCSEKIEIEKSNEIKLVVLQSLLSGKTIKREWKMILETEETFADEELESFNKKYEGQLLNQIKNLKEQCQNLKLENKNLKKELLDFNKLKSLNESYLQKIRYLEEKNNPENEEIPEEFYPVVLEESSYAKIAQKIEKLSVYSDDLTISVQDTNPDTLKQQLINLSEVLLNSPMLKYLKKIKIQQDHLLFDGQCYDTLVSFLNKVLTVKVVKVGILNGCNVQPKNWTCRLRKSISVIVDQE